MISQNVFIVNYNSLYEILDEIKEILSFKIIKFKNEEDFKNNNDLDTVNCLIISKTNPKLLTNDITDRNLLDFTDLPLSLKKILEIINIKLIKLKFKQQSKVMIKGYELNLNSKFFSKDNLKLKLTVPGCPFVIFVQEFDDHNGDVRNALIMSQKLWRRALASAASVAQQNQQINRQAHPGQIAFELVGAALAFQVSHNLLRDRNTRDQALVAFNQIIN